MRTPICASACATSSMFSASSRKSSSSTIVSANSSTSAGGFASAATGMRPTIRGPSHASARRSSRTRRATVGRCTLTTTDSPVRSTAACTCAIDAAASGCSSNSAKTSASGRPRSSSTIGAHHGVGLGRHAVTEPLELADQLLGEQPVAAGDDLAELDVGGSEPLEAAAQPGREPGAGAVGAPLPHVPAPERPADRADDARGPAQRRDAGRGGERSGRRLGPGADAGEAPPPRQVVGVDDPRAVRR